MAQDQQHHSADDGGAVASTAISANDDNPNQQVRRSSRRNIVPPKKLDLAEAAAEAPTMRRRRSQLATVFMSKAMAVENDNEVNSAGSSPLSSPLTPAPASASFIPSMTTTTTTTMRPAAAAASSNSNPDPVSTAATYPQHPAAAADGAVEPVENTQQQQPVSAPAASSSPDLSPISSRSPSPSPPAIAAQEETSKEEGSRPESAAADGAQQPQSDSKPQSESIVDAVASDVGAAAATPQDHETTSWSQSPSQAQKQTQAAQLQPQPASWERDTPSKTSPPEETTTTTIAPVSISQDEFPHGIRGVSPSKEREEEQEQEDVVMTGTTGGESSVIVDHEEEEEEVLTTGPDAGGLAEATSRSSHLSPLFTHGQAQEPATGEDDDDIEAQRPAKRMKMSSSASSSTAPATQRSPPPPAPVATPAVLASAPSVREEAVVNSQDAEGLPQAQQQEEPVATDPGARSDHEGRMNEAMEDADAPVEMDAVAERKAEAEAEASTSDAAAPAGAAEVESNAKAIAVSSEARSPTPPTTLSPPPPSITQEERSASIASVPTATAIAESSEEAMSTTPQTRPPAFMQQENAASIAPAPASVHTSEQESAATGILTDADTAKSLENEDVEMDERPSGADDDPAVFVNDVDAEVRAERADTVQGNNSRGQVDPAAPVKSADAAPAVTGAKDARVSDVEDGVGVVEMTGGEPSLVDVEGANGTNSQVAAVEASAANIANQPTGWDAIIAVATAATEELAPNPASDLGPNADAIAVASPTTQHHPDPAADGSNVVGGLLQLPTVARMGVKVPGSSDGGERGEECWMWSDWPMNKMGEQSPVVASYSPKLNIPCGLVTGFRYMPCGPSPNMSPQPALFPFYRTIASQTMPFVPNSACVITTGLGPSPDIPNGSVHLDWSDRSTYLKVSSSALTCTTDKGFRSARANVAVRQGRWYFEVLVLKGGGEGAAGGRRRVTRDGNVVHEDNDELFGKLAASASGSRRPGGSGGWADGAHVRVGWARREASLNGPVGLDGYSYGIRDGTGEKVTLSRPRPYGVPFGTGDVVGCLIDIPPASDSHNHESVISRKRIPIRYKGQLYFESVDYTPVKEMDALVARDGKKDEVAAAIADGRPPADIGKPKVVEVVAPPVEKGRKGVKRTNKKGDAGGAPATDGGSDSSRPLPTLPGSSISFFLNGRPMTDEPAFRDLFDFTPLAILEAAKSGAGARKASNSAIKDRENPHDDGSLGYYPMISCYGGGKAQLNPGPQWYKPPTAEHFPEGTRPLSDRWHEWAQEEAYHDEIDEAAKTEEVKNMRLSPVHEGLPKANGKGKPRSKGKLLLKRDSNTPARSTPGLDDNSSDPSASTRSTPVPQSIAIGMAAQSGIEDAIKTIETSNERVKREEQVKS